MSSSPAPSHLRARVPPRRCALGRARYRPPTSPKPLAAQAAALTAGKGACPCRRCRGCPWGPDYRDATGPARPGPPPESARCFPRRAGRSPAPPGTPLPCAPLLGPPALDKRGGGGGRALDARSALLPGRRPSRLPSFCKLLPEPPPTPPPRLAHRPPRTRRALIGASAAGPRPTHAGPRALIGSPTPGPAPRTPRPRRPEERSLAPLPPGPAPAARSLAPRRRAPPHAHRPGARSLAHPPPDPAPSTSRLPAPRRTFIGSPASRPRPPTRAHWSPTVGPRPTASSRHALIGTPAPGPTLHKPRPHRAFIGAPAARPRPKHRPGTRSLAPSSYTSPAPDARSLALLLQDPAPARAHWRPRRHAPPPTPRRARPLVHVWRPPLLAAEAASGPGRKGSSGGKPPRLARDWATSRGRRSPTGTVPALAPSALMDACGKPVPGATGCLDGCGLGPALSLQPGEAGALGCTGGGRRCRKRRLLAGWWLLKCSRLGWTELGIAPSLCFVEKTNASGPLKRKGADGAEKTRAFSVAELSLDSSYV